MRQMSSSNVLEISTHAAPRDFAMPHVPCSRPARHAIASRLGKGRTVQAVLDAVHRGKDGPGHGLQRLEPVCSTLPM